MKAYIPDKKTKRNKPVMRGLWLSDKQGVCYDYLHKADISAEQLPFVKKHYRQEAIFCIDKGKAYVWYNTRKVETLQYWKYYAYDRGKAGLKAYIKDLLKIYGGLTVYIREGNYLFETWTA